MADSRLSTAVSTWVLVTSAMIAGICQSLWVATEMSNEQAGGSFTLSLNVKACTRKQTWQKSACNMLDQVILCYTDLCPWYMLFINAIKGETNNPHYTVSHTFVFYASIKMVEIFENHPWRCLKSKMCWNHELSLKENDSIWNWMMHNCEVLVFQGAAVGVWAVHPAPRSDRQIFGFSADAEGKRLGVQPDQYAEMTSFFSFIIMNEKVFRQLESFRN